MELHSLSKFTSDNVIFILTLKKKKKKIYYLQQIQLETLQVGGTNEVNQQPRGIQNYTWLVSIIATPLEHTDAFVMSRRVIWCGDRWPKCTGGVALSTRLCNFGWQY